MDDDRTRPIAQPRRTIKKVNKELFKPQVPSRLICDVPKHTPQCMVPSANPKAPRRAEVIPDQKQ